MLTRQENNVFRLNAFGFSAKEIADKLCISTVTAQNHLKHIKEKLNLQKSTELVAFYWCKFFGTSLEEQKRAIAGVFFISLIFFQTYVMNDDMIRFRRSIKSRKYETEITNDL